MCQRTAGHDLEILIEPGGRSSLKQACCSRASCIARAMASGICHCRRGHERSHSSRALPVASRNYSAAENQGATIIVDVVGPVCESGDFLARDREMPNVLPGDLLAICTAGAYGFVAASNYNSRPRPVEILVEAIASASSASANPGRPDSRRNSLQNRPALILHFTASCGPARRSIARAASRYGNRSPTSCTAMAGRAPFHRGAFGENCVGSRVKSTPISPAVAPAAAPSPAPIPACPAAHPLNRQPWRLFQGLAYCLNVAGVSPSPLILPFGFVQRLWRAAIQAAHASAKSRVTPFGNVSESIGRITRPAFHPARTLHSVTVPAT